MNNTERLAYGSLLAAVFCITFSIFLGQVFLLLCFALTAFTLWHSRQRLRLPAVFFFAGAFILLAFVVSAWGVDPARSLVKIKRLLWFAAIIPVAATLVDSSERLDQTLWAFALGALAVVGDSCVVKPVRALYDLHVHAPGASSYSAALTNLGSMTEGQMLVAGVLIALGFFLAARREGRQGRGALILLLLLSVALLVNLKRGSWAATGIFAGAYLAVVLGRRYVFAVLALVVLALALPTVRERLAQIPGDLDPNHGGRGTMWFKIAPRLVHDHPWGIGYAALTNERMRDIAPEVEKDRTHLHSNLVQVLVDTGWLGLALYLAWMARTVADGVALARRTRAGPPAELMNALSVLFVFLALLANGLVEYNFGDTEIVIVYAVLMGVTAAALARARGLSVATARMSQDF